MIAEHILKVGAATEQEAKLALSTFFLDRFTREGTFDDCPCPEDKEPQFLAAGAAMNVVFGEIDLDHQSESSWKRRTGNERALAQKHVPELTVQFASENGPLIEKEIKRLSSYERLCAILSGAAYNVSYARYIKAGGSHGIFSNLFITNIRTLFSLEHTEVLLKTSSKISDLDQWILRPIDSMLGYGILRRFPQNPNEREYYNAVHAFAVDMNKLEIPEPVRRTPLVQKVKGPADDAYPTREQMAEMFSAWKQGGKDGIAAVLRKRQDERNAKARPATLEQVVLRAYAAMVNTLDASKLEPLLPEDFHYASQDVFAEIESKAEYMEYITGKLETIRSSGSQVWAEMGWLNNFGECVVLAQGAINDLAAVVVAKVEDGKLKRLDMCTVAPSPHSAKRSGEYPV